VAAREAWRPRAGKQAEVLNVVLEDVLHAHPISEQRMKEVLGHTPLQARAACRRRPGCPKRGGAYIKERPELIMCTNRGAVRMTALHVLAACERDKKSCC